MARVRESLRKHREIRCYESEDGRVFLSPSFGANKYKLYECDLTRVPPERFAEDAEIIARGVNWLGKKMRRWEGRGSFVLVAVWEDGHAHINWIPYRGGCIYLGKPVGSCYAGDPLF